MIPRRRIGVPEQRRPRRSGQIWQANSQCLYILARASLATVHVLAMVHQHVAGVDSLMITGGAGVDGTFSDVPPGDPDPGFNPVGHWRTWIIRQFSPSVDLNTKVVDTECRRQRLSGLDRDEKRPNRKGDSNTRQISRSVHPGLPEFCRILPRLIGRPRHLSLKCQPRL